MSIPSGYDNRNLPAVPDYESAMRNHLQSGNFNAAFADAERIPQVWRRSRALEIAMKEAVDHFIQQKDFSSAIKATELMPSDESTKDWIFSTVAKAAGDLKNFPFVIKATKLIQDKYMRSSTRQNVATALVRQNALFLAVKAAGFIPDERMKSLSLTDIANAFTLQKKFSSAIETANLIPDSWLKDSTLMHIAKTAMGQKKFSFAIQAARLMSDLSSRNGTLGSIAEAAAECGIASPAIEATQLMGDQKFWWLSRIAPIFAHRGDYDSAIQVARSDPKIESQILHQLVKVYVADPSPKAQVALPLPHQIAESIDPFSRAIEAAQLILDEKIKSKALTDIVKAMCEKGNLSEARKIAELIPNPFRMGSLYPIIEAARKNGNFLIALEAAQSIVDPDEAQWHRRDEALYQLTQFLVERNELPLATQAAQSIGDERFNYLALECHVVKQLMVEKKFSDVIEAASSMRDKSRRNDLLSRIAVTIARSADDSLAVRAAQAIQDPKQQSQALCDVVEAHMINRPDAAITTAEIIPDEKTKSRAFEGLSELFLKQGKLNRALDMAKRISDEWRNYLALDPIVEALIKREDLSLATTAALSMIEPYRKSCALLDIIKAWLQKGEFLKAIEIADLIPDLGRKTSAIDQIIEDLANPQLFHRVVKIAQSLPDGIDKTIALSSIAIKLAERTMPNLAIEVAKTITDEQQQTHIFLALANTFLKQNTPFLAELAINLIRDPKKRAEAKQEILKM